jgi:hypothetical protein
MRPLDELEKVLRPPAKRPLNEVIAHLEHIIANPGVTGTTIQTQDLETLIAAAKVGRDHASDEVARSWGVFQ